MTPYVQMTDEEARDHLRAQASAETGISSSPCSNWGDTDDCGRGRAYDLSTTDCGR